MVNQRSIEKINVAKCGSCDSELWWHRITDTFNHRIDIGLAFMPVLQTAINPGKGSYS